MMKRLLTIFIIACVFFSCENDRPANDPNNGQKPIKFDMTETRAAVTEDKIIDSINKNGFGVFAFVNKGANDTPEASIFESLLGDDDAAESVTIDKKTNEWTYKNTKYWTENHVYHFFGVYPLDASYTITKDISNNPTGISRSFATPEKADEDLVAAYTAVNSSIETPTVDMNFEHMLAKVIFIIGYDTINNEDDEFTLTKFSISNIKKEGTLQSLFTDSNTHSWSINPLQNITFEWSGEYEFGSEKLLWEDGLMLIPQTIAPGIVNISVKYKYIDHYVDKDGDQIAPTVNKEVDTYLPEITWKPGQQYTYRITLHEDDYITFKQIEVATWGSPQQGGAIIIK